MLIDCVALIRPREYSICSIPVENKVSSLISISFQISIIVALVEYKTRSNRLIKGLCSQYLENLKNGERIRAEIKKGTF
jgi:sulfite reductase alpha subunit-like flavoprotein